MSLLIQVHNVATALTQMTHAATQHNVPIMATHTQQPSAYVEETSKNPSFQMQQTYYDACGVGAEIYPVAGRGRSSYTSNDRRNSSEYGLRYI